MCGQLPSLLVPHDRGRLSWLVTSVVWLFTFFFEAPASKELTHFQELHPKLFRMKLLFLKSQLQASHWRKKHFLCSLSLWRLPSRSLLWSVSGTLLLYPPTHTSHRRPSLQGSSATERNLSHLQGCEISWLSACVPLQRPPGLVRCLAGLVMLSAPLTQADSSPEKDAFSIQSTIHQKHVSSFFLLTFWNPLWGSPTKLSKFVLRVGLLKPVIKIDSAWLTKKT